MEMEMAYVCLGMEMSYRWFGMGDAIAFWGWRERSRSAQTQETGFFRSPLPRHRYLGKNPISQPYRALPKPKKPGFLDQLCLDTDILSKNPISQPKRDHALPKPKKPGFFAPLCLDTDILAKTRFLTRARSAQTKETKFFRAPLPRHRYLVQKPGFSPERDTVLGMRVFWGWGALSLVFSVVVNNEMPLPLLFC